MNAEKQLLGQGRMLAQIERSRRLPIHQSVMSLVRMVEDWCGQTGAKDDLSLLALEMA